MENNKKSKEMIEIEKESLYLVKIHVLCGATQIISELSKLIGDVGFDWSKEMRSLMEDSVDYDASLEGSDIYINYVAGEGWYYGEELRSECDDCDQILQGTYNDRGYCLIDALKAHSIDLKYRRIREYWIVSSSMAWWLERQGEKVVTLLGLHVWGRATTGQHISEDYVIKQIARMLIT